ARGRCSSCTPGNPGAARSRSTTSSCSSRAAEAHFGERCARSPSTLDYTGGPPAMEGSHSILIAHGHAPTRIGVRQALRQSVFEIVGEADCAEQAIELCLRERPELSLLDLELPGGGLWAAREISTRVPDSAVLVLSACASDGSLLGALRAGAVGYLMMDLDPARLPN